MLCFPKPWQQNPVRKTKLQRVPWPLSASLFSVLFFPKDVTVKFAGFIPCFPEKSCGIGVQRETPEAAGCKHPSAPSHFPQTAWNRTPSGGGCLGVPGCADSESRQGVGLDHSKCFPKEREKSLFSFCRDPCDFHTMLLHFNWSGFGLETAGIAME